MSIELLIVNKITTSIAIAAVAEELSTICRLPELVKKEFQAVCMDLCQREALMLALQRSFGKKPV